MRKKEKGQGTFRVREIRLDTQEQPQGPADRTRNTELVIITYVFVLLFALLVGTMVWLNTVKHTALVQNVNNTKKDSAADRIIRGSIVTEEGAELAVTNVDADGRETRYYPYGQMFAHVVGYASNGKGGLEASMNYDLLSTHSSLLSQLRSEESIEKVHGDSVVTTFNPVLQEAAYYALGSNRGAVVVMEPDSGKILAMVSKPDFDPNTISQEWESMMADSASSALLNRACQGRYPPGSTFKILTALGYLRAHPTDWNNYYYDCQGAMSRGDITINCYNWEVHGGEDLEGAFAHSCNTAFASIGLELDNAQFKSLAESFCFNTSLPTSLPHSQSVFRLEAGSSEEEQMTTAIGQGNTLVTPLHMCMIASCVANGGIMMKPYCVSRIQTYDGETVSETTPSIYKELMSADEAQILTQFMKATVNYGTAQELGWGWYSAAGKTGSAEYETEGATGTHSWFVGFSNVDDPDLAIAVIAEDGGTGSATAVPIARAVFDAWYGS